MGNCQAVDAASLVIQHPNGKVDKMYEPVSATQIMKINPGFYVALLITSTISHTSKRSESRSGNTVRITRVKLLRPTDTLTLGHVYRLISTKEVMKGLVAKKQAKMRKSGIELADSEGLREAEILVQKSLQDKTNQAMKQRGRSGTRPLANGGKMRPKTWQPSLNSISEFAS